MRWQLASTFAVSAMSAGCYEPATVDCGDGFLCPKGQVCADPGFCGLPNLVEQRDGEKRFHPCTYETDDTVEERGLCLGGVCNPCSLDPNLAGCGTADWFSMTSPMSADLYALWLETPEPGYPVTHAFGGGKAMIGATTQSLVEYDGEHWSIVPIDVLNPSGDVLSIWGSRATDVYVATSNKLVHYDGSAFADITANLPQGTVLKDVTGTSGADVYVVGLGGTIVHFDGSSWSPMNTVQPATWNAAVPDAGGIIAVGASGSFRAASGAFSQPLPAPYNTAALNDVFYDGSTLTVVGADTSAEVRMTMLELVNGTWTPVGPPGTNDRNLYTGWGSYIAGMGGLILHRTEVDWQVFDDVPANKTLFSMAGSENEVFVVGEAGAIWRYAAPLP